jgi:hypothetical protein
MRSTTKKGFVIPKKAFAVVLLGMELFKKCGQGRVEGLVDGFFVQNSGFGSKMLRVTHVTKHTTRGLSSIRLEPR